MNENYTPIERKTQGDYNKIADAFFTSRKQMRWPELDAMLEEVKPGQQVLDIGCGTGRVCNQLEATGVDYFGIDISEAEIALAKEGCPQGDFRTGSMLALPYEDNSFDVVFHIAVLHHLLTEPERVQAIQEAMRVLKPGGRLNLMVMGLWQKRYWKLFFQKQEGKQSLPAMQQKQVKWSDVFIPWSWKTPEKVYRYYHAFRKRELKKLFSGMRFTHFEIFFVANGKRVPFWKAKNLVVRLRKGV